MARKSNRDMPTVINGIMYTNDEFTGLNLSNPSEWNGWTEEFSRFYYTYKESGFSVRNEKQRNEKYWYAYKRIAGKLHKLYVGYRPTIADLEAIGAKFQALLK